MNLYKKLDLFFRLKIWAKFKINFYPSYYSSHSQFGEDMVLRALFDNKKDGFYVDIGAHHPVYYSNTYHFYIKGWRGLNIDAAPGSMEIFEFLRSSDTNKEICIGPLSDQEVDFYIFDKPALNTFDPRMAELANKQSKLIKVSKLKTKTLAECLESFVPKNKTIDFLSIDVEGLDEMILRSNNWEKFRPQYLVFESHDLTLDNYQEHHLVKFLQGVGYSIVSKTGPSFIAKNINIR